MNTTITNHHKDTQGKVWNLLYEFSKKLEPGMFEDETSKLLNDFLAQRNLNQIWHPTVLKFDESTLNTSVKHKPVANRKLTEIAIIDLGIVVDGLEIDCGDSFAFTPSSLQLTHHLHQVFQLAKSKLLQDWQSLAPSSLYKFICECAQNLGVQQISSSAGHLVGPYPTPKREVKITSECIHTHFPPGWWMIEIYLSNGKNAAFFEDCVYLEY